MQKKKADKKTVILILGILLMLVGVISVNGVSLVIGGILLGIHKSLKKKQEQEEEAAKKREIFHQADDFAQQKTPPPFSKNLSEKREFSHPIHKKRMIPETHRTERNHDDHRVEQSKDFSFGQAPAHSHHSDLYLQARREISNLKNIRYARSELSGKTLSDTVIWHTSDGVCSSVVQVIRQANLRYPDLSDRELSQKILADKDLMEHLVRSLEWERRTELR